MDNVLRLQSYWSTHVQDTPLAKVKLSEALAEYWLKLYATSVIGLTLPDAIQAWLRKCERDKVSPTGDLYYLRNYIMACLRSNQDKCFVLESGASC